MKTVFLTALTGLEIRNFLASDFYLLAQKRPNLRLVVFVDRTKYEFCKNKFSQERCIIEPVVDMGTAGKPWRKFLNTISYASIASPTVAFRQRRAYLNGGSFGGYWAKHLIWLLGHVRLWRKLLRGVEWYFFRDDKIWAPYFEKYRPDIVLGTSLTLDEDTAMLKYARRRKIPIVGMVRSWDNLTSKTFLRIHPDMLLVQNPHMIEEAEKLADMPRNRIRVVGFPQFDYYLNPDWHISKKDLGQRWGIDPDKRWIVYFTGGLPLSVLDKRDYTDHVEMLVGASQKGTWRDASILVRVHPNDNIILRGQASHVLKLDFGKGFEFSWEDTKLLLNLLRASDVTINLGSTIALEAAIFDKPLILAAFDGYHEEKLPWQNKLSVTLSHTVHYCDVEKTGGIWRVENEEELIRAVQTYLENPSLHREGRKKIVETLVGPVGGASERILKYLV